ncbi:MAG: hypothetical protein ABL889_04440 [Terricaulis sp.]
MATRTLWFIAKPGAAFVPVPACDIEDFVGAIYQAAEARGDIQRFDSDNRASLATYWEWMPREAFRLKNMSEALQNALQSEGYDGDRGLGSSITCTQGAACDAPQICQGAEHE